MGEGDHLFPKSLKKEVYGDNPVSNFNVIMCVQWL